MGSVQIGLNIHIKLILLERKMFNQLKEKTKKKLLYDCSIRYDHFIFSSFRKLSYDMLTVFPYILIEEVNCSACHAIHDICIHDKLY